MHAIAFAAEKHRNQRRKDAEASPYINHPIALANVLVNEAGIDDDRVIIAALLHDTIEDTQTTKEELQTIFGKKITKIVLEVTDDKTFEKAERKRLQVEHAPSLSRRAKLVKLADKVCNLRDIANNPPTDWSLRRRQEYFDWAKAVVDGLRGANKRLEKLFALAYSSRPESVLTGKKAKQMAVGKAAVDPKHFTREQIREAVRLAAGRK
jgi:guanosine-3',5'-bis(diphosphate) 3'-pyrophosphohydrolase